METPRQRYERRINRFSKLTQKLEKADRMTSNLRLAVFAVGAATTVLTYLHSSQTLFAAVLAGFSGVFIFLVIRHGKLIESIKYNKILRDINADSLKRLAGEWHSFPDGGEEFCDYKHSFSGDLDLFGKNSLFQWVNTAQTFLGRIMLKDLFSGLWGDNEDVLERQGAVDELAEQLSWRQSFLAEGMLARGGMRDPEAIIAWAGESNKIFRNPRVVLLLRICPLITLGLIIAGFGFNLIPAYFPAAALIIQMGLLAFKGKDRSKVFSLAETYARDLRVYYKMLRLLEEQGFKSPLIGKIKAGVSKQSGLPAHKQLNRLSAIIDSMANRRNMFYVLVNIVLMRDFHNLIALERWKQESGDSLKTWFEALGRMEVLSSLAVIRFDNPHWAWPRISDGLEAIFSAEEMGHPLLGDKRVHNDLAINQETKVLLITGSNMSGKSTLLRTAGINLVLAYAGAPVCAKSFHVSPMEIISCMRVSDDLSENVSSFYAELLRIKEIVEAAQTGKRVFFLLDEVFKGTNSYDRHAGAKVLVNKLSDTDSIGLVSTHDLELCNLERENPRIANFHFQEHYRDGKIYFDYRLRPGPSTTRNALYLMRLAGIEIE